MAGKLTLPLQPTRRRLRNLAWIGLAILLLFALLYSLSSLILLDSYTTLEGENIESLTRILLTSLDHELWELEIFAAEEAANSATQQYAQDSNARYLQTNWQTNTFTDHNLNLVLIIDNSGQLLFTRIYSLEEQTITTLFLPDSTAYLNADLTQYAQTDPSQYTGIILTPPDDDTLSSEAILFAAVPIADLNGQPVGTLMLGRFLQATQLNTEAQVTNTILHFHYRDDPQTHAFPAVAEVGEIVSQPVDHDTYAAYTVLNDITGQPNLLLHIETPRDISAQGHTTINFFLLVVVVGGLALALSVFVLQEIDVMARIRSASSAIQQIGQSGDLDARVPLSEHHELGPLTESINQMLATLRETTDERTRALDAYTQQLVEERDLMRMLIDNLPERVYIKDTLGRFVIANQALANLHGFPRAKDLIGKTDFDLLPLETAQFYFDQEQALLRGEMPIIDHEMPTESAEPLVSRFGWTWTIKRPLTNREGQIVGVVGIARDITARREIEDALRRAHDELEQRVAARTAELSAANDQLQREMIDRARAQHALATSEQTTRAFQEKLKALHAISIELAALDTLDALHEQAVILGRSKLDFDRLGIWRLNADQTQMRGAFGTDPQGRVHDASFRVKAVSEDTIVSHMLEHDERVTLWDDHNLDEDGTIVGSGWNVMASLWNGTRTIGWLAADNLINQRPLEPYQIELLTLYGATLGYLITQLENALALRASEARYSGLFNGMPVSLYRTTRDGKFLAINPALATMLGYAAPSAMQNTTVYDFYVSRAARAEWRARIEQEDVVRQFEAQIRKSNGDLLWIENTAHAVRDEQGAVLYYEGSLTDISARKRTEKVLELAMNQVQTQANELTTVSEVSRQIATILDIDELLWTICDQIKANFSVYYVQIYLYDEDRANLVLVAGSGETGRTLVRHEHHIPLDSSRSLVARAGRTGQPVVINDVTLSTDFLPNALLPKTRAELAIPMLVGSEFIGVLDIQADAIDWFQESIVNTKAALAVQVAIAIHNAQLFTTSARRLAIIENSTDLVVLADLDTLTPTYINAAGLAMLGLPSTPDFKQHKLADFYTPAMLRRLRHGILPVVQEQGIWRGENRLRRADGTEIPVEQTLLTISTKDGEPHSLATIITDITERKLAEQALRRANRAYQAFSECNQAVVRATADTSLLADICNIIVETGGYRMAWAGFVRDGKLDDLQPIASAGHEDGFLDLMAEQTIPTFPNAAALVKAARRQQPIVVAQIASDPTFAPQRAAALQRGYQAAIALPLVTDDIILGVLTVYADQAGVFDEQEIVLLTELANDLAYGITMVRTREERHQIFQRLQANEANLTAVIENTDAAIWSVNTDLELVTFNSTLRLLFKLYYQIEVQPSMKLIDALPENERLTWQRLYDRALQGDFFRTEHTLELSDLPAMNLEVSFNPIISRTNEVTGVNVFSRDITGRKQYEKMLESLNTQLGKRNDELFTLYDIGRKLAATLDPRAIYHLLFEEVVEKRLEAHTFFVSSYDAATEIIRCDFAIVDGQEIDPAQLAHLPLGEGPQSQAIRTRQPHIVDFPNDPTTVPSHYQIVGEIPLPRSGIYVPLLSRETVSGVIYVQHQVAHAFDDADLNLLSTLANQVAIALQNARLFTGEHQQRLYAETLREIAEAVNRTLDLDDVFAALFSTIQRIVPFDAVTVMLIDSRGNAHISGSFSEIDYPGFTAWSQQISFAVAENAVLSRASASPESILVNDTLAEPDWQIFPEVAWERAYACARIMREGQVIGFLNVYSAQPNTFTTEHGRYLAAFAYQVGNAIRNAQLFANAQENIEMLRAQAEQLATINRVSSQIAQAMEAKEIYRITTQELQHALDVSFVGLILYADENWGYLVMDTHPDAELYAHLPQPLTNNPTVMYLRQTHQSLISVDARNDPLLEPIWEILRDRGTHSLLVVPLIVGNEVIGSVGMDCYTERHFTDADRELAETIVNQAAIAITKAQLYAAERDQRLLAETLSATAQTINQTLDLSDVLDRLLENVKHAIPYDAANIMLLEDGKLHVVHTAGYERYGTAQATLQLNVTLQNTEFGRHMLATGEPYVRPNTLDEPDWEERIRINTWIRSIVHAPIMVDGQTIGLLNLDSGTPNTYNQHHAERLQAFAYQAANAIRNARLFTSEREQRTLSEALRKTSEAINSSLDFDEVLRNMLINIGEVVPHDAATIMLIDEERDEAYVVGSQGYQQHNLEAWIRQVRLPIGTTQGLRYVQTTNQPFITSDTHADNNWVMYAETSWIRSHATVPISRDNRVIGYLMLDGEVPDFFTAEHIPSLTAFADQVAIAIQNAHLFTAERDQRELAEALRDTAKVLNSTLDVDTVLDNLLEAVRRVMPHDAANIMLIDDAGVARIKRSQGYARFTSQNWIDTLEFKANEVPVWQHMLQTGLPFAIPDVQADPNWLKMPEETWIRSSVKAPIKVDGRIMGILHLDSNTLGAFNQDDAERLQAFADQAALAIRNAQLFQAEHQQRTHAEALRDIANALTGSVHLADVGRNILEIVARVVPHDAANIMVIDRERNVTRIVGSWGYVQQGRAAEKDGLELPLEFFILLNRHGTVVVPDTHAIPNWSTLPGDEWIRSYVGTPIRLQNETIGMLNLDSATPNFYTTEHAEKLRAFTNQIAVAIQTAQLFEATQRHAAELEDRVALRTQELNQQSSQLQAILDSMSEGVIYDEKLTVKYINPALTRLTGYGPDEFPRYLAELYRDRLSPHEYETHESAIFKRVLQRGLWAEEVKLRRKDGSEFDAALTVTRVINDAGETVGAVTVIRDISQEKALQEQKDRFIANASHELRTPLANIKTRLYLLQKQPAKADRHLTILNQVSDNMAELIENLLDVSRFERGVIPLHRHNLALQTLVEEVTTIQQADAETKGIDFQVNMQPAPLIVWVDRQRITQVFTNLIANAINYTQPGGQITVSLLSAALDDHPGVEVRVIDTGIGIKAELIEHVFEPFFRADEQAAIGTGLGLTIAHDIVQLHDGDIRVESEYGVGSTFIVWLPLTPSLDEPEETFTLM